MAKKLIALTGDAPVSYRDGDEGERQGLLLFADNLTSPQVYPEDYEVCAPTPGALGPLAAASVIPQPNTVPAGLEYSDSGIITGTPQNLSPAFLIQPGYALPAGMIKPTNYYPLGFTIRGAMRVNVLNPGAGSGSGNVGFGLFKLDTDGNIAAMARISLVNPAGAVGVQYDLIDIDGAFSSSQSGVAPPAINRWVHFVMAVHWRHNISAEAQPHLDFIQFVDGADDGLDVAPGTATGDTSVQSSVVLTPAQYEGLLDALDGGFLGVYVGKDTQNWAVELGYMGVGA